MRPVPGGSQGQQPGVRMADGDAEWADVRGCCSQRSRSVSAVSVGQWENKITRAPVDSGQPEALTGPSRHWADCLQGRQR